MAALVAVYIGPAKHLSSIRENPQALALGSWPSDFFVFCPWFFRDWNRAALFVLRHTELTEIVSKILSVFVVRCVFVVVVIYTSAISIYIPIPIPIPIHILRGFICLV